MSDDAPREDVRLNGAVGSAGQLKRINQCDIISILVRSAVAEGRGLVLPPAIGGDNRVVEEETLTREGVGFDFLTVNRCLLYTSDAADE